MAEKLRTKVRVKAMYIGDVITSEEASKTAQIATQLPYTFRDDVVGFDEGEPEEVELLSHELDTPLDVEFVGQGVTLSGTFISPTNDHLVALVGGKLVGKKFHKSAKKVAIEKAIKIVCHDESEIVIPHAKGYVLFKTSIGKDGKFAFPFKFKCLPGSQDWDVDLIL